MRGSVKKRGQHSWSIRFDLPRLSNEPRRQYRETIQGTRPEADQLLARRMAEISGRRLAPSGKIDLATYLHHWLEGKDAAGSIADSVLVTYRQRIEQYIVPTLGGFVLRDLNADHIERAIGKWRRMPRADRKKGWLKDRTIRHIFDLLRNALEDARRRHRIPHNPCEDLDPPDYAEVEVARIDEDQAQALLPGLADRVDVQIASILKLTTGVRRGEACAFTWNHLDPRTGFLHVRQKCIKLRDGSWAIVDGTKNGRPRRVPVMPVVQRLLEEYRAVQQAGLQRVGKAWSQDVRILATPTGDTLTPDQLSSAFTYLRQTRGLPKVSLHGLRHSFTSIGGSARIPLEVRSHILGHSGLDITRETYDKVHDRVASDAASALEALLGAAVSAAQASSMNLRAASLAGDHS